MLLEVARLVTALHAACAGPQQVQRDGNLRLFDQSWVVTACTPAGLVLESADRLDPAGPRDVLVIILAGDGAITGLERFQSDPSTVAEPGFMVRRVRLDGFRHPRPEPTAH